MCSGRDDQAPVDGILPNRGNRAGLSYPNAGANPTPTDTVVAFPRLTFTTPLLLPDEPDGSEQPFVAEPEGRVRVFPNDPHVSHSTALLGLGHLVHPGHGNEDGLPGLAFDPDDVTNGLVDLHDTADQVRRPVTARFTGSPRRARAANSTPTARSSSGRAGQQRVAPTRASRRRTRRTG